MALPRALMAAKIGYRIGEARYLPFHFRRRGSRMSRKGVAKKVAAQHHEAGWRLPGNTTTCQYPSRAMERFRRSCRCPRRRPGC